MRKCLAGVTLALPLLETMAKPVAARTPRRFCAMDTANGMSLPNPEHGIDEWSWFPKTELRAFEFGKSTRAAIGRLGPLAFGRRVGARLGGGSHSISGANSRRRPSQITAWRGDDLESWLETALLARE